MAPPHSRYERALQAEGHVVVGVDEVGCGSLAGPVVAAAVELFSSARLPGLNDSKLLTPLKRERLFEAICRQKIRWSVGLATVEEVEQLNVRQAGLVAMRRAVERFSDVTYALVDAWTIPGLKIKQRGIIHGDRIARSIAAASVVAKVVRDSYMSSLDLLFPAYGFRSHKGYGTRAHIDALRKNGPSSLHRRTFIEGIMTAHSSTLSSESL